MKCSSIKPYAIIPFLPLIDKRVSGLDIKVLALFRAYANNVNESKFIAPVSVPQSFIASELGLLRKTVNECEKKLKQHNYLTKQKD